MGFLDKIKYSAIYENRIKRYGVHPQQLPPDLHAKLCTACHRDAEYYTNNKSTYGSDSKTLAEQCFIDLADTVVLCLIGPSNFDRLSGYSHMNIIEDLVGFWISKGPESETRLLAIHGVNNLGKLNREFADIFISTRQQQEEILKRRER